MKRSHKTLLRGLLGMALLALVLALAEPMRVVNALREAKPGWLLAGMVAAVASNVVSALRWRALARWLGSEMSARDAQRWYFQAMGLNALVPGAVVGGDVYRAVMLRRAGQDTLASSWSVILDRVSGLWMLCLIGCLGAALSARTLGAAFAINPSLLVVLALAGAALWLALPWLLPPLLRHWTGLSQRWVRPLRAATERPDFSAQVGAQALQ